MHRKYASAYYQLGLDSKFRWQIIQTKLMGTFGGQHGGYEEFLNSSESNFEVTGESPEDMSGLLAIAHLVSRRNRWFEFVEVD